MADTLLKSQNYTVKLYIVDKQRNPFNAKIAEKHVVIPSLDIEEICSFAKKYKSSIDFGVVGPEKPIINGVRDLVEKEAGIPLICPIKKYAIEASKVAQRLLFEEVAPEVNPRFRIFNPKKYPNVDAVKEDLWRWLDELDNQVAVKPDRPAAGKGVGVWGDHFTSREALFDHFMANFEAGAVIVEEKLEGEESSFQCFCDGKHVVPLPETRDYKRAFDGDKGPNTGGMGSYKGEGDILPFMTPADKEKEIEIIEKLFKRLSREGGGDSLRGVPFYTAFIHTSEGPKILENNSRPGDPEIMNLLPLLKEDFVDICFKILDGDLKSIKLENLATVVTYKVPPSYGGFAEVYPDLVDKDSVGGPVELGEAYRLSEKLEGRLRVYPGSMELRADGRTYALGSRTVCTVGVAQDIAAAREISLEGLRLIKGGGLWHRNDIASQEHIDRSIQHMKKLRG